MKSNLKTKTIILIILGILYGFSPLFFNNPRFTARNRDTTSNYNYGFYHDNLKISAVSGKIHIDNNWTAVKAAGICTGNGNYSDPYIIEDLIIDAGGSGNCIWIQNSDVHFKIENCTIYNTGYYYNSGFQLTNTDNGLLVNNSCSFNYYGMYLDKSNNNTIIGNELLGKVTGIFLFESNNNTISRNDIGTQYEGITLNRSDDNLLKKNNVSVSYNGIDLLKSDNNAILENILKDIGNYGIILDDCSKATLISNIMKECGVYVTGSINKISSIDIDPTNLVNGKPLFFYKNKIGLDSNDFNSAGQIILINCSDSIISNVNVSGGSVGIILKWSTNNNITNIYAYNNLNFGIYLADSDNNIISGSIINNNKGIDGTCFRFKGIGIQLINSNNNVLSYNEVNDNYDDGILLTCSHNNSILNNKANFNGFYNQMQIIPDSLATGIHLYNSNNNLISGNEANGNIEGGIFLYTSNYNDIFGNTVQHNYFGEIYLSKSNYTVVTGNFLLGNDDCIIEYDCKGNKFSNNGSCTYGQSDSGIPGYNLFFLLGILSVIAIMITKKLKKS